MSDDKPPEPRYLAWWEVLVILGGIALGIAYGWWQYAWNVHPQG